APRSTRRALAEAFGLDDLGLLDGDAGHFRRRGTASTPLDQCGDSIRRADDERFDVALRAVAHPARDAETLRLRDHPAAIEDALHAPADEELAGDRHAASPSDVNAAA